MSKCDWRSIDAINETYDRKRDATPQYIKERALNNYYCCPREYIRYDITYQVLGNQGEIIREEKSEKYDGNVVAGLIKFIYESGKEEVWQLYIYEIKEEAQVLYDPDEMMDARDRMYAGIEAGRQQTISDFNKQQERNRRWKEACQWAKDNGVPYISSRFNRRETVSENVKKAGKRKEWNTLFPEFYIKGLLDEDQEGE